MGIFKRKYGIIKTALAAFGKALGNRSAQNTKEFWSARSDALRNDRSWARVIAEYLADRCSAEDREFIAWVFFRARGAAACCGRFYICERTYYTRRETVLSDILCLATGYGLIDLGANTAATEAARATVAYSLILSIIYLSICFVFLHRQSAKAITECKITPVTG